jgi:hypothetical protein
MFIAAHNKMVQMGIGNGAGWIIGEAYYNDATAASGLRAAMDATGRPVFYLMQWPLERGGACQDATVAPPTAFNNYSSKGF